MESNTIWFVTIGVLATVIAFDLLLAILRRNKETTLLEASFWTVFYVGAAIVFGFFLPMWTSDQAQKEFFAGWLTEYALSVDNIFVFVIILSRLKVEKTKQQLVLLVGIIFALVLRVAFIAAGSAIIQRFTGAFFIFGAFLIYTAYRLLVEEKGEEEWKEDRLVTMIWFLLWIQFLQFLALHEIHTLLFASIFLRLWVCANSISCYKDCSRA